MNHFQLKINRRIAHIHFDMKERSANLLSPQTLEELAQIIDQINTDPKIIGAVLLSNKQDFSLGADVHYILQLSKNMTLNPWLSLNSFGRFSSC